MSWASSPAVARSMRANRSTGTKPELILRDALAAAGIRSVMSPDYLWGRPDFVLLRSFVVVFVDGDYWHSCPEHGSIPKTNAKFWRDKFRRNAARDRLNDADLADNGWTVYRVWECRVEADAAGVAAIVASAHHRALARAPFAGPARRGRVYYLRPA